MRRLGALVLWGLPVVLACGTEPIPRVVVAGTTFTLPIPQEYPVGFGRVLYPDGDPNNPPAFVQDAPLEDPQRGEMRFRAVPDDPGDPDVYLPVRFITRVSVNESAPGLAVLGVSGYEGQVIAILEVPSGTIQGNYKIQLERWRRNPANENKFDPLDPPEADGGNWIGWAGAGADEGVPIRIVDHPEGQNDTNPLVGWGLFFGALNQSEMTDEDVRSVTPNPTFRVNTPASLSPGTPPAAWEIKLTYPPWKFKITDVNLITQHPSDGLVTWDTGDPSHACGTADDTLTIQVVDSGATPTIRGVWVAFETQNFAPAMPGPGCEAGPAQLAQVQEVTGSFKAYDKDGVDYAISHDIIFCEACK
jgi:hypothetical protein